MQFLWLIAYCALLVSVDAYKSSKAKLPPLKITRNGQPLAPGYFVFTHKGKGYLINNAGQLVYEGRGGSNFRVATLHGKQVLSYFNPNQAEHGFAYGHTTIKDNSYKTIHVVCPKLGLTGPRGPAGKCQGDLHESYVTNHGTLIVTAYNVTPADLSPVGGAKNGWVLDGQFYEIDIATDKILFSWKSLDHVPLTASYAPVAGRGRKQSQPYDYFHINSVDPLAGGRYLVSGRDTSAVYLVGKDGGIIWEFNGHGAGTFTLGNLPNGKPANFAVQHDARLQKFTSTGAIISFFNNDNPLPTGKVPSTGMEWELNTQTNTSTLLKNLRDPTTPHASYKEGDFDPQPNGNIVLGYGAVPLIQEFGPNGNTDVRISIDIIAGDYRSTKSIWYAAPRTPPSLVVDSGTGYVSWLGATNVTGYAAFAGSSPSNLTKVAAFKKTKFENSFALPASLKASGGYVQARAYEDRVLLGKSKVVKFSGSS